MAQFSHEWHPVRTRIAHGSQRLFRGSFSLQIFDSMIVGIASSKQETLSSRVKVNVHYLHQQGFHGLIEHYLGVLTVKEAFLVLLCLCNFLNLIAMADEEAGIASEQLGLSHSNMITGADNAKSGRCFRGVLRRLLCSGSLQTHPSDQITQTEIPRPEKEANNNIESQAEAASASAPSIVARLMGLDSLPATNWVPRVKTPPDSVPRSRSVNFMDYLLEFDLKDLQHHLVKTSVSFREVSRHPLLHQQKYDNFLLLYLDKMDGLTQSEPGSELGKPELGFQELKQPQRTRRDDTNRSKKDQRTLVFSHRQENRRTDTAKAWSKFKDEPRTVRTKTDSKVGKPHVSGFVSKRKKDVYRPSGANSMANTPAVNRKEELVERKFTNRRRRIRNQVKLKRKLPESEEYCNSENSSINGVFRSSDEVESKMTRKEDENENESVDDKQEREKYYRDELVRMIFRLTEKDIKESTWIGTREFRHEDEDLCMEFGQEILNQVLQQLVDELVGFDMQISIA